MSSTTKQNVQMTSSSNRLTRFIQSEASYFKWLNFSVAFFDESSAVACAFITHARTHTKEPWGWSLLFIASDNIRKQKPLHISCRSLLFFNYLRSRQNIFVSPRPIRVAFVIFFFSLLSSGQLFQNATFIIVFHAKGRDICDDAFSVTNISVEKWPSFSQRKLTLNWQLHWNRKTINEQKMWTENEKKNNAQNTADIYRWIESMITNTHRLHFPNVLKLFVGKIHNLFFSAEMNMGKFCASKDNAKCQMNALLLTFDHTNENFIQSHAVDRYEYTEKKLFGKITFGKKIWKMR